MKKIFVIMMLALIVPLLAAQELSWYTSQEEAFKEAAISKKILFVDVYTQWCSWCKKLANETFKDASFVNIAAKFVLLKVDADVFPDFKAKYKVKGYPTMLFLKANGEEAYPRVLGYVPASELVPIMKKALGINAPSREITWLYNITDAFAQAQASNRIVFVDVYTEWCSWCKKLDKETFSAPKFQEIAAKFVLLKVDGDKEIDFRNKYQVKAYPTMLFLNGNGDEVKRIKGFLTASELVPIMEKVLQPAAAMTELSWHTNINDAFAQATNTNRLVFVDVYTDECSWCKKLENETFPNPDFIEIAQLYVLLKVNANKEYDFCNKYKVRAYPTMLFLKSTQAELFRIKGFQTAEELVPTMKKVLEENGQFSFAK